MKKPSGFKGRGSADNPKNRFEKVERVADPEADETSSPATQFLPDASKSIIAYNDSPDVGFDASINPYRGCEHGCIYCYARPTHEYLGFSAGLDFETRIMVKRDAPELLRKELSNPRWKPQVLASSGVTDCYQPIEKKLEITRRCLEVLAEFRNPVIIITKNHLVTRDIDILSELARHDCAAVFVSITTLDEKLSGRVAARAPSGRDRRTVARGRSGRLPAGADDSRSHRFRSAGDRGRRRRGRRALRRLCTAAAPARRQRPVRGLARAKLP
jgi:hypothetical protein